MRLFLKFGIVGAVNTGITIISYILLLHFGLHYILANSIAYILGVINSFYWNKKWVFQHSDSHYAVFLKFVVVNLFTLAINSACLFWLVHGFHIHPILSQIIGTGIGIIVNFFANKIWTFGKKTNSESLL